MYYSIKRTTIVFIAFDTHIYPKLVVRVYGSLALFWSCSTIRQTRKREKDIKVVLMTDLG